MDSTRSVTQTSAPPLAQDRDPAQDSKTANDDDKKATQLIVTIICCVIIAAILILLVVVAVVLLRQRKRRRHHAKAHQLRLKYLDLDPGQRAPGSKKSRTMRPDDAKDGTNRKKSALRKSELELKQSMASTTRAPSDPRLGLSKHTSRLATTARPGPASKQETKGPIPTGSASVIGAKAKLMDRKEAPMVSGGRTRAPTVSTTASVLKTGGPKTAVGNGETGAGTTLLTTTAASDSETAMDAPRKKKKSSTFKTALPRTSASSRLKSAEKEKMAE